MTTPSGVLNNGTNKTRGKIPNTVVTFVSASNQGQRTNSAQTNYLSGLPKFALLVTRILLGPILTIVNPLLNSGSYLRSASTLGSLEVLLGGECEQLNAHN